MRLLALPAFEDNYIWALVDDEGDALVIDPGDAAPVLAATGNGLWPAAVLVTHHHPDHAGGIAALRARWPTLPVFAPRDERIPEASDRVGEGDVVQVKHWRLSVLEVPGHTRSHIAFHGGSPGTAPHLFCGDTLFSLGCGRLFEGTPAQMFDSLTRLAALPGQTAVYCAHEYTELNLRFALTIEPGNRRMQQRAEEVAMARAKGLATVPSTLALEKATNSFLRCSEPEVVVSALGAGASSADPLAVFTALRERRNGF